MRELEELTRFWMSKHPTIAVTLWPNSESTHYYGKMYSSQCSKDLSAATIGELIAQGEAFLRTIKCS